MKYHIESALKANLFLPSIVIIIIFFLYACDNNKPVKIGFIGGLTGKHNGLGVSGRNGTILALEEINKKGGINGRNIQLIIKDDMQDAKVLQKALGEFFEGGVTAIIGPMTSGMSLIAIPSINEKKIVMISPTATSSKLAQRDDYFIKLNSNISVFSDPMVDFISDSKRLKRISALFDLNNRAYSEEFLTSFKSRFQIKGGKVISEEGFDTSEKISYKQLSQKLLKNNPDGILIIANTFDTAMICQHIKKLDPRIPIFSSPWAMTEGIISLGGKAVEGLIFGHTYLPDINSPDFKEFKKRFEERFGREPDFASVKAYDAANLLFSMISNTQSSENLKDAIIKKQRFKGVMGDYEIDRFGDIKEKGLLITINENRFIKIE